jgi:hypothetical protein
VRLLSSLNMSQNIDHYPHLRRYLRLHPTSAYYYNGLFVLVLVLVVDTLGNLARVGGVADDASLPRGVFCEYLLEVEGVVNSGEAEVDVGTLVIVSIE